MSEQSTQSQVPAVIPPAPQMPARLKETSAKGAVKYRQGFDTSEMKTYSFSQMREKLKVANPEIKGKALTKLVAEKMREQLPIRNQLGMAFITDALQRGAVFDHADETKNGIVIRLKFPPTTKAEPVTIEVPTAELSAKEAESIKALAEEWVAKQVKERLAQHAADKARLDAEKAAAAAAPAVEVPVEVVA